MHFFCNTASRAEPSSQSPELDPTHLSWPSACPHVPMTGGFFVQHHLSFGIINVMEPKEHSPQAELDFDVPVPEIVPTPENGLITPEVVAAAPQAQTAAQGAFDFDAREEPQGEQEEEPVTLLISAQEIHLPQPEHSPAENDAEKLARLRAEYKAIFNGNPDSEIDNIEVLNAAIEHQSGEWEAIAERRRQETAAEHKQTYVKSGPWTKTPRRK